MNRLVARIGGRLYELATAFAYRPYRTGRRRQTRAAVPVVSVGNIAMGGTGKTPLVAALARALRAGGALPAILTRGYKRREHDPVIVLRDPSVRWELVGDEPALLARALPDVPIVVDPNRVRGAATAVRETRATHLVLDDGFQHWRLARDLDVVVVDAMDPLCECSPRRERPRALERADVIVISGAESPLAAETIAGTLTPYAYRASFFATRIATRAVHIGSRSEPPQRLVDRRVVAMAGLAQPEKFVRTLRALGADVIAGAFFPDHHPFTRGEIEDVLRRADAHHAWVVVTAKDAVKFPLDLLGRIVWLEVEAAPVLGTFEELLAPVM